MKIKLGPLVFVLLAAFITKISIENVRAEHYESKKITALSSH